MHATTAWKNTKVGATDEGRAAADWMRRRQAGILLADVESFEQLQDILPPEWIDAASIGDCWSSSALIRSTSSGSGSTPTSTS